MSPAAASMRWQRDGQRSNNCSRRMCQRIDHLSWQHHSYSPSWHCQIQPIRPSWKCLPKVTPPIRGLIMLLKDENTTDSVRIFPPSCTYYKILDEQSLEEHYHKTRLWFVTTHRSSLQSVGGKSTANKDEKSHMTDCRSKTFTAFYCFYFTRHM